MSDEPTPTPAPPAEGTPAPPAPPAPEGGAPPQPPISGEPQTPPSGDVKPLESAPVVYTWKAPEGFEDRFKPEAFEPLAKSLGLKPENAQEFIDGWAKTVREEESAREESWKQTQEGWVKSVKEDPKIGGANFEKTQSRINAVTAKWGTPALKEFFDSTGVGNHPELCRLLAAIGAEMEQDTFTPASGTPEQEQNIAKRMRFFEAS